MLMQHARAYGVWVGPLRLRIRSSVRLYLPYRYMADAHAAPARNALAIIATTTCGVSERAGATGSVVTVMAGAWASALAGEACGEAAASARGSALSAFTTSSEDARAPKTGRVGMYECGKSGAEEEGETLCEPTPRACEHERMWCACTPTHTTPTPHAQHMPSTCPAQHAAGGAHFHPPW